MFFANDIYGERIHIDDAVAKHDYVCPACKSKMIQKRGNINAHHFAHKAGKECDPWYTGKLSAWHTRMQSYFPKSAQEVVVWNEMHTEYHIADAILQNGDEKYIVEFQHSVISQKEFVSRSTFYMRCGYRIIWVFDFCECNSQKRILIADDEYENNIVRLVWPGKDRIKFLDSIDFSDVIDQLYIVFHINTGRGKLQLHDPDGYYPWETWEYVDPFHRHPCFVSLFLDDFNSVSDFYARRYSEEEFYKKIKCVGKKK